ncbi:MAG: hypothetical protein SFZ02_11820 [bacterium]|nr:hypothetical protein [bacterium]
MTPGTIKVLHLVVKNIAQICQALTERGVAVGELQQYDGGRIKYARFSDPDGNSWLLQEMNSQSS